MGATNRVERVEEGFSGCFSSRETENVHLQAEQCSARYVADGSDGSDRLRGGRWWVWCSSTHLPLWKEVAGGALPKCPLWGAALYFYASYADVTNADDAILHLKVKGLG